MHTNDIMLIQFTIKILYAVYVSVTPFGVLVLNHSDVLRDPSFRSKAAMAGAALPIL